MTAAGIAFERVEKRYGDVVAVADLTLEIAEGTLVTLLGPSGCGKTTTLRMIAGLELPTRGTIRIGGRDVTHVPAADRDVSMVFQSYALFPHMTVFANVRYGLSVSRVPRREADERARAALEMVGLGGLGDRQPSELSGGQQQRVALARALVLEPSVLLFDEPLSNLDARLRRQMRDEIRDLQRRLGLTVVYVTHDQSEAMAVSDRIVVMDRARVAQEGSPRDLYQRPETAFVAGFMGDANRVPGRLSGDGADAVVTLAGVAVAVPGRSRGRAGDIEVAIRPEAVRLAPSGGDPASPGLAGTVAKAAYLGAYMEYEVDSPLGRLFVVAADTRAPFAPGDPVLITFDPGGVVPLAG